MRGWVARYNAGGADALADRPGRGRKAPLTPEQELRLAERLLAGLTPEDGVCTLRGEDIRRILEVEFGVVRRLGAVYLLLHRLGFEPLRPRPAPPPRRPGRLQKSLPERVAGVAAARPGDEVEVWFEDEARFGQRGTLTRVRARLGSRPVAPEQTAYANLHVLSAVCPATGRVESTVTQGLDTQAVQVFLD